MGCIMFFYNIFHEMLLVIYLYSLDVERASIFAFENPILTICMDQISLFKSFHRSNSLKIFS